MRTLGYLAVVVAAVALAPAAASAMKAAPDPTPLLFDRVRAFPAVVVATLEEGFEKNTPPEPGTNCVRMTVKVVKVLKADKAGVAKVGPLVLSVHGELPKLLAARDKDTPRRYLLAVNLAKDYGYLGTANLYGDLERFFSGDAGMEKVVEAFIKPADDQPVTVLTMCAGLLADKELTEPAARHVFDLLAKRAIGLVPLKDKADKPVNVKETQAAVEAGVAAIKAGKNVAPAVVMLVAFRGRQEPSADVKFDAAAVLEPVRKWLDASARAKADPARPDYRLAEDMGPAIELLGKMKDTDAKDVLVKIAKDNRWASLRVLVIAAIREIFGDEAEPILKDIPRPPMRPGLILD